MIKKFILVFVLLGLVLFSGCAYKDYTKLKTEANVGTEVSVSGVVKNSVKIGDFSGFILVDVNGEEIGVLTKKLQDEGKKVTISGVLMKDSIFGYYVKVVED